DAGPIDQSPRLVRLEAFERVDVQPRERLRLLGRDLLDLDAALGREHEQHLLRAAVEGEREVVLLRDVGRLLDPELAHDMAVDVEPEDLLGLPLGVSWVIGELDPTGLAATARQDLRLDDDRAAELLRGGARLGRSRRRPALGGRDPEAPEKLFALVLGEVHRARTLARWSQIPWTRSWRVGSRSGTGT